jgi:hypothetical protein
MNGLKLNKDLVEVIVGTPVKERGNSRQIYYSVSS